MANVGTAFLQIKGDFGPLRAGLRRAETSYGRQVESLGTRLSGRLKQAAKVGAVALGAGAVVGAKKSVDAAVDLGEQINKTMVVFRGAEKDVLAFGETSARSFGISNRAALEAAGTFGNMLVPMGITRKEAAGMSVEMVKLAADMASFNNASPEETLDAIRSGLAGESEPLRRFGVDLREAALQEFALKEGIKKSVKEMTNGEKAQLAYKKIINDTSDAQGDFARTSDSLANQQRTLKAQFEDIGASLGKALLPGLQKGASALSDFANDVSRILNRRDLTAGEKFDRIGDEIAERLEAAVPVIAEAAARIGPRIAVAFVKGFLQAPALVQLVAGAWVFAKGRALLTAFGLLGTQAGASFGAGVGVGAAGGAAGGAAAGGVAGGAAAGGLAGLATRLKLALPKLGFIGVGIASADLILKSMEDRMDERSDDLNERLKALAKEPALDALSVFGPPGKALAGAIKPLYSSEDVKRAERLKTLLDQAKNSRVGITNEAAREAIQLAKNLGLTRQQLSAVRQIVNASAAKRPSLGGFVRTEAGEIGKALQEAKRLTPQILNEIIADLNALPPKARKTGAATIVGMAREMESRKQVPKGTAKEIANFVALEVEGMEKFSIRHARRLARRMGQSFQDMYSNVINPTNRMARRVASVMEAFGASGVSKIRAAIARETAENFASPYTGKAKGGFLEGSGRRDTIPIMAAPGEAVLNRHQQKPVETALRSTFGIGLDELFRKERRPHHMAQGGRVERFQFGGRTTGGGRLVTGDTDVVSSLLTALERLARASKRTIFIQSGRRTLAEQAALYQKYAGSRPVAAPSPNAPHVRGIAADITPGSEVFGAKAGRFGLGFPVGGEPWHIELVDAGAIQGGARGSGGAIPAAPDLGDIKITGRRGAIRDLAQAAADKVSGAAQRFVDRLEGPTRGGGSVSANRKLGRQMSRAIFGDGEWGALSELWQRESGWSHTAENPSSGAYGIPQALPASKMGSAGKDWKTNAATQIKWGLNYIRGRYGSPSAALAFHDAHNWYQRGGFVDEILREGGFDFRAKKSTRPKNLKVPKGGPSPGPGYKWDAAANKWVKRKGKSKKPFRSLPEIGPEGLLRLLNPLEAEMHRLLPAALERIQAAEDVFTEPETLPDERTIPRLRREGHNIEKIGDSFVDWTAVEQRKSELTQALGQQLGLIGSPFGAGKGLMEAIRDKLNPLRDAINAIVSRFSNEIDAIKKQVRDNMRKHQRNEKRIEKLDERIEREGNRKKPDRRKIRDWRDEKSAINEENENLRRANRRLTGESQPSGDLSNVEGGELGRRQAVLSSATESLDHVQVDREDLVGISGVGGQFASIKNAISDRLKELGTLTSERIRESVTPTKAETDAQAQADIKSFLASIGDLYKTFGPNFRPIANFAGGGRVEAPIGAPVPATVHGGELIVDPKTGALSVKVIGGVEPSKTINVVNNYQEQPKDPHTWSRNVRFELEAAV